MPRGGYRIWKPCRGSNRPAKKVVTPGSGRCSECDKVVAMYRNGFIARHKPKDEVT